MTVQIIQLVESEMLHVSTVTGTKCLLNSGMYEIRKLNQSLAVACMLLPPRIDKNKTEKQTTLHKAAAQISEPV